MLKQFVEYVLDLLNTARDTRANKEALADLREEVDQLASAMERVTFELRSLRDEERHEREKLLLRLENALLKFERQLPPSKESKKLK